MTKAKKTTSPAKRLTASQLELIREQQKKNLLRKLARGRVLSASEMGVLEGNERAAPVDLANKISEEEKIFLTPAEFERWLGEQGVKVSHQNLYKTYLGKGCRHPVHRSPDGKRVHKWKALELVRLVQGGEQRASITAIAERQAAEARFKSAKARQAELLVESLLEKRIPVDTVHRVWGRAVEDFRNELRTLEHNLPEQVEGKSRSEVSAILAIGFREALKHLAVNFADRGEKRRAS